MPTSTTPRAGRLPLWSGAVCLAAGVLLAAPLASAQTPAPAAPAPADTLGAGPTVTLAEAVRIALGRSPDLARAVVADRTAELAVRGALAQRLPAVSFQASPAQQIGLGFDQTTGQLTSQRVGSLNVGLGADVRLFDGGRTRGAVEGARLDREAAAVGVRRTEQQVALDVAQRFLQLLLDRELVRVQAGQLAAAESQRAQVSALVEGGARARGDLIAQEAVVAERRAALVEAEGAVARDEAVLVQATGLDPLSAPVFVGPSLEALEAAGALGYEAPPLAALLERARETRADVRAQALRIRSAEAGVRVARAQGRPTVDASASLGTGYSSLQQRLADPAAPVPTVPVTLPDGTPVLVGGVPFTVPSGSAAFESTPLFAQAADNRSARVGFTVTVPIFDRYTARRAVEEARVRTDDARLTRDALLRQVDADVQTAAVEAQTAVARLAAARVQVEAATAALRVERDRYELGAGTLYTVADAQARLAQAEAQRAQAAYGLVFRAALVRLAVGDVDAAALAAGLGAP